MAPSSIPHRWKYDVFVSYRGDIRKGFVDHLYKDFKQKGIRVFTNDLQFPEEEILPELYKLIEESRCLIVIFSQNYASSPWCLRELVKILECKRKENPKHEVQIIYYDVKPTVVRKQTNSYAKAFARHEILNPTEVAEWKTAVSSAADLCGWDLQDLTNGKLNLFESKFIDSITREILKSIFHRPLDVEIAGKEIKYTVSEEQIRRESGLSSIEVSGESSRSMDYNVRCPKCSSKGVYYHTQQTRSADEGQTMFYNCPNCGYNFTDNT